MPIRTLRKYGMKFPEIARLRKGTTEEGKRRDGTKFTKPVDLDYFRIVFPDDQSPYIQKWNNAYPEEPRTVNLFFPFDDIPRIWDYWFTSYTFSRLVAKSDGEYYQYLVDTENGETLVVDGLDVQTGQPRPHNDSPGKSQNGDPLKWQAEGRLKMLVPELQAAGYVTFLTHSIIDVTNITDLLDTYQTLLGRLTGVPFQLVRRKRSISIPGKTAKERMRVDKWMVDIDIHPDYMARELTRIAQAALPTFDRAVELPWLPSGFVDEDDLIEGEVIDAPPVQPTPAPAQPQTKSVAYTRDDAITTMERPYPPDVVKYLLDTQWITLYQGDEKKPGQPATEKHRQLLAKTLNACYDGDETKRYEASKFLTGFASTKEIPDWYVLALLKTWLDVQDWESPPAEVAIREARAVADWALIKAGQQELPLE